MDDIGRKSGHLMLITPERVFYAGLLGRPRERCSGAFNVYVAIKGGLWLTTADGRESYGELVAVPPNVRHTIASDHRSVICVVIEPESVRPGRARRPRSSVCRGLNASFHRAPHPRRLSRNCANITPAPTSPAPNSIPMCLGEALPRRELDPRVVRAIRADREILRRAGDGGELRREAGLSPSRFLHLFKEETGISFRSFRAWKRARHLLHFANQDINLAHLAQDIGYPNSTHFSHSIRSFYGLKPRAIFSGSRDLAIYRSGRAGADNSGWTQEAG